MMNLISAINRYFNWRNDCLFKAPYFPVWCDTGAAVESRDSKARHMLRTDGAVEWNAETDTRLPYADHVEMSGFYSSAIISYGATRNGSLRLHRHVVFPMFRMRPNDTRGSLSHNFRAKAQPKILIDGKHLGVERIVRATLDGMLTLRSASASGIEIERTLFPAVDQPALIERVTLRVKDGREHQVHIIPSNDRRQTSAARGVKGAYTLASFLSDEKGKITSNPKSKYAISLSAEHPHVFYIAYCATRAGHELSFSAKDEEHKRRAFLTELSSNLRLETPDCVLNTAMEFAKIRACESIFRTKNGLMHAPGGGSFYAALWTNDQCEYTNPLFPLIGYKVGLEQAGNSFRLFQEHMDDSLSHPLVSSIVAEGEGVWNGAGDRGDGAMFAYGAARYALARGDKKAADQLWNGIVWGIEYSLKQKNEEGVIRSDSDELENRFPSGDANLFTSCLVYDALLSAAYLAEELQKGAQLCARYRAEAEALKDAIERYFGARIEGYDTYQYYQGNDVLRAWICVPLTVGILTRAKETLNALWSERLWSKDGLRSQAGCDTFWDRATLFALRGAFAAGDREQANDRLVRYTQRRLLGEHVPYAVEAWPEGNQKHLSAESALYMRVYTEGLFGIRPTGLRSFTLRPQLPQRWDHMALRDIYAFGSRFSIEVHRKEVGIHVTIESNGVNITNETIQNGACIPICLEK
ncbi:MAG: hypothetical protein PHW41_02530 [Eubacteriales bacterium]|nr:hypothetical protein [Eubacteriales bacterium]